MFVRVAHLAVLAAGSLIASASAAAQQAPASAQEQPKAAAPKEDKYCETITMTGSRLAKKKFCGTRAEWAEKRLQDRQAVDRIQTMPCMPDSRTRTGRPSC